jgi:hypothetical protein
LQTLENPQIRKHLGLKDDQTGVMITKIAFGTSAHGVLKEGDVILKMDEYPVANNGTIAFAKNIHGDISLAVHKHHVGETMQVQVLRNGTVQSLTVPLLYENPLVPLHQYNIDPPYYLYCGVLFQPLSFDLLERFFQSMLAAPQELLFLSGEDKTKERSEIVVVTRIFRDEANFGYEGEIFSVVTEVNGQKISCLKDMVEKIENPKTTQPTDTKAEEKDKPKMETHPSEITIFKTSKSSLIILPAPSKKNFKHATKRIEKQYNIKEDRCLPE